MKTPDVRKEDKLHKRNLEQWNKTLTQEVERPNPYIPHWTPGDTEEDATWKEKPFVSTLGLRPVEQDEISSETSTTGLYILWGEYKHATLKNLSPSQQEIGSTLSGKLRSKVIAQLKNDGWKVTRTSTDGYDIWEFQPSQIGAKSHATTSKLDTPVSQSTLEKQAPESLKNGDSDVVPALETPSKKNARGQERRAKSITYTCERCEQSFTELRYPGPTPRYCSECKSIARKENVLKAVIKHNSTKQEQKTDYSHIDRFRMPARLIQPDSELETIDYSDYYVLEWINANSNIGSYRVSPLKNTVCQDKKAVMRALKNAFNCYVNHEKIKFENFIDAIAFCKHMGIRVIHHTKDHAIVWLTQGTREDWY